MNLYNIPSNSFDKSELINKHLNSINTGEIDPLKALAALKHLESIIESIKNDPNFYSLVQSEIDKYGKGEKPTALGYEVGVGSRRTFDYSQCGDIFLEDLKDKAKTETDKVKDREKFLQSLKQKVFDSENGGFEICPPIVKTSTYFILKEVKQGIELPKDGLPF